MTRKVATAYGKQILATGSQELIAEFGGGFSYAAVNRAIQFCQGFADLEIVSTQLSWSHFIKAVCGLLSEITKGVTA
jgi:hypothetical protein